MTARKFHTFRFVGSPSVRNLCASLAKEPSLGGQTSAKIKRTRVWHAACSG